MQIPSDRLESKLSSGLPPVVAISGNEVLLVEEALDRVRKALLEQGVQERLTFSVEAHFDWNDFSHQGDAMSLFGSRRCLELRIPTGKPGDKGSKAISVFVQQRREDGDVLVLILPKLDKRQLQAKWVQAVDEAGWMVVCPEINLQTFPAWLKKRFESRGLRLEAGVLDMLCTCLEGNLLAAGQEVDKLAAMSTDGGVTLDMARSSLSDQSRYTVFELVDMACSGDVPRAARILRGLRREGIEPVVIIWSLAREIRTLARVASQLASGGQASTVFRQNGVWKSREAVVGNTVRRLGADRCYNLLVQAGKIDQLVKGQRTGDIWLALERLVMSLGGVEVLPDAVASQAI